jgi:hypothetical protein
MAEKDLSIRERPPFMRCDAKQSLDQPARIAVWAQLRVIFHSSIFFFRQETGTLQFSSVRCVCQDACLLSGYENVTTGHQFPSNGIAGVLINGQQRGE